ncbi:AAA family ATPase [Candidatus Saccharibacteria bacterium]|nr:AAA family ATPase [Candidatus Saccharibacteria bacterium]
MTVPIIHPVSEVNLALLMKDLPQSLLLAGPVGVGLGMVAQYIAREIGDISFTVLPEKDEKVNIEKGVISVDSIRRLYLQTRSIQSGKRIIIIDYAERMGHQAQNAFLKLLEEPGEGTYFILVTHSPSSLLATITSRAQLLELRPITSAQSETLLDTLGVKDSTKRTQLLFMANGLPAELTRLVQDETYFESRASIVRDARDILQASTYQKLLVAHKYKDNRDAALTLLEDAGNLLRRSISLKPHESLIAQIDALLFAQQQIQANGNIRLCLARLVV